MSIEEVLKAGNYHLIDVREPMELEMDGNIEEAQNIPLGELEERKQEISNLAGNIIFFCRSGNRSGKALEYLESQGLKEGFNGGGWSELKHALDNM